MEDAGRHGQGGTSVPAAGLVLKQTPMAGEGARCAPRPERWAQGPRPAGAVIQEAKTQPSESLH